MVARASPPSAPVPLALIFAVINNFTFLAVAARSLSLSLLLSLS